MKKRLGIYLTHFLAVLAVGSFVGSRPTYSFESQLYNLSSQAKIVKEEEVPDFLDLAKEQLEDFKGNICLNQKDLENVISNTQFYINRFTDDDPNNQNIRTINYGFSNDLANLADKNRLKEVLDIITIWITLPAFLLEARYIHGKIKKS